MTPKEKAVMRQLPNTLSNISRAVGDNYAANTRRVLVRLKEKGLVIQNEHKIWSPVEKPKIKLKFEDENPTLEFIQGVTNHKTMEEFYADERIEAIFSIWKFHHEN